MYSNDQKTRFQDDVILFELKFFFFYWIESSPLIVFQIRDCFFLSLKVVFSLYVFSRVERMWNNHELNVFFHVRNDKH